MNYLCVIQARCSSQRLPGKVLMELVGKSVIEHVVSRVKRSSKINCVYVATSIEESNEPLLKLCVDQGIKVFIGSEDDVLDRFYQLSKLLNPKNIVRITADCPLIDASIIDRTIECHEQSDAHYTKNSNMADGMGCEIFSMSSLEDAWQNAKLQSEREHVTPFIRSHYHVNQFEYELDLFDRRWTLDELEDYQLISNIFDNLYLKNNNFAIGDILNYLSENPEIESLNSHIGRDEGYYKSLNNDKNYE